MSNVTDGLVNKTETKVIASTGGAASGGAIATFLIYLTGVVIYHADATAEAGSVAVNKVPFPVTGFLFFILPVAGAYFAGKKAPHTSRTVVELPPAVAPADPGHAEVGGDLSGGTADPDALHDEEVSFDDDTPAS